MLPIPRPYQNENDLARLLELLQAGRAARIDAYYVHVGDLKWSLFYPPLRASPWQHVYLWEDPSGDHRLMGCALLSPAGDNYEVYYHPELHGTSLAEEMFAWADDNLCLLAQAAGVRQIGIYCVTPEDTFRSRWLEQHGYRVTTYDHALVRSLTEPIPDVQVPEEFRVRSCKGLVEVEARAKAQYGAFGSSAPFDQYLHRFTHFMNSVAYNSYSDVVAATPDGEIASFCITWIDPLNQVGLFEPVGTHPYYQRKGLGKAVMREALRRLQEQGMQQAIICTTHTNTAALHLYASVGFQQYTIFNYYSKDPT